MRRTLALLAAVALVAVACGSDGATDAGPVPGRPETTVVTVAESPTTTAAGSPPTTAQTGSTQVSVWLAKGESSPHRTRS